MVAAVAVVVVGNASLVSVSLSQGVPWHSTVVDRQAKS